MRASFIDDTAPVHVSFERAYLAWEGFDKGIDYPLDVRLSNITVADRGGRRLVAAPSAHVTFSFAGVLLGRIIPRAIEVDHAKIAIIRKPRGAVDLGGDIGAGGSTGTESLDLKRLQEQISRPASSDHGHTNGLFDQIRRAHFRNADVTFRDQRSGLLVRTSDLDLDLVRAGTGHVHGLLRAPLSVGEQQASLTADADWAAGLDLTVDLKLTAIRPARIGPLPSALAFIAGIDAPIALAATVNLDRNFALSAIRADIPVGEGQLNLAQGDVPVRSGLIALSATQNKLTVTKAHFDVAHTPEGRPEIVEFGGTVSRVADRLRASLTVALGRIDIADLPRLWPLGLATGARPWIIEHVTSGATTHGMMSLTVDADEALQDIVLTKAEGYLDGSHATFTWIDNIPPIDQTDFQLHLVDPDTLDIHLSSAHQRIGGGGADLLIKDGQMRITGLSVRDQIAVIHTQVEGPVASTLALLKEPRLHLLSDHPIALKTSGGEAFAKLDLRFPLQNKLRIDDVQIHADARVSKIRLLDVAAGHELDDGIFDFDIGKDGLGIKGRGTVAAIPVDLSGTMDFKSGRADQIVQKIAVTAQPEASQLESFGLRVNDFMTGPVPLTVVMIERRGGDGSVAINGDLTLATLAVDPLAWSKASGSSATVSATMLTSFGRVTKIDKIVIQGDGLMLRGSADFVGGHIRTVLLDDIRLGRSEGHAMVRLEKNQPVAIVLQGDQIDLSAKVAEKRSTGWPADTMTTKPDWTLDARFKRVILANRELVGDLLVKAACEGETVKLLDVVGSTHAGSGFSIKIEPQGVTRHLIVDVKDAGSLLRGLDVGPRVRSGHLHVDGIFSLSSGFYPLSGTATLDDSVVKNSPVMGKILQAISLYGLVDALSGPGMNFSHVFVAFHYDGADLSIEQARGYNSSLGFTANGRIGLLNQRTSIVGTIVPVYFFNSMLGKLPLVGGLFSPEIGGGVFAASFTLKGKITDPNASIDPISVLTPGFFRGMLSRP